MRKLLLALFLSLGLGLAASAQSGRILFDATKHEQGGNADWVIDADAWNLTMPAYPCTGSTSESNPGRYPTPAQSGITPTTPNDYWTGGISAWAVELAKAGHTVESLPNGAAITYGNGSNPQDLSNYDLFIAVEPQNLFSAAEKSAILAFVNAGGGFFMVADHETSDRDCDGYDSPMVYNDLTGATGTTATGLFGIWFRVDGLQVKGEDWFDDGVDNNVTTDPADPIIHGPFGDGSGGLGFFGATSMDINPADNPTVTAHVWRTGQPHNNLRVTFATASYGAGRVAAIGDSSPADDNSGDPGDTLYPGWDLATGGVKNKEIHLNACHWLLNPAPDTTAPSLTAGPSAAPADCTAAVAWTTDEGATSLVEYGPTSSYGLTASAPGYATSHSVPLAGLSPGTLYHYRVSSTDASGNGPTVSLDATFTTTAATPPSITAGPAAASPAGTSATVTWTTSEAASSTVAYGLTAAYGSTASAAGFSTAHSVTLTGLTPETLYHYQVSSTDPCGNGPALSTDATFTTGPASLDLSGWVLKQFNSTQTFTFPPGTVIPSGGYLILARDATRAQFEALFPSLPAAAVFVNSNPNGSCPDGCFPMMNGAETFELWNGAALEDGTTLSVAQYSTYHRKNPGDPAGVAGSWTQGARATASPGTGAGTPSASGVVINEMSDNANGGAFEYEFLELYYDATSAPADTTPPAAVADLAALALSETEVRLSWTAPGDDGATGTATGYNLRYSLAPITEGNFAAATAIPTSAPQGGGAAEQLVVAGLSPDTPYYFALKSSDEVPNASSLSNVASATTLADAIPPSAVADLSATPLSDTSVRLTWTAPGDDGPTGTAALYDLRRSDRRILSDADFDGATPLTGEPAPALAGTAQQMTVPGLTADTAYYFALKTKDDAGPASNWSPLSNWTCAVTAPTGSGGGGANHLVISQFNIATGASDMVEIFNPTSSPISLSGYTLRNLSSGGGAGWSVTLNAAQSVPAHGWYLVSYVGYAGSPAADENLFSATFNFSGSAGHIVLVNRVGAPATSCTDGNKVDKVGYAATATCPEGGSGMNTAVPTSAQTVIRRPNDATGNGQDTDVNSADFLPAGAPAWHNSASPPATPPAALGNVGQTLFLSGSGTTALAWGSAYGATGYRIYKGAAPGALALWQTPALPAQADAALPTAGEVFYYAVRATDGTNESAD